MNRVSFDIAFLISLKFITHLCQTQMTMYLKQLSGLLFKKPRAMDVILQFTSPASVLRPLCQFLEDWHYDSDQGRRSDQ
jgi:mediator of RNA polymerase II transcription subunit 5